MNSRRSFLKNASIALAGQAAIRPLLSWARGSQLSSDAPVVSGAEGMIVRSLRFLDLEMPPEYARTWITPVPHFYVRNHMMEPEKIDIGQWKLTVGGGVEKPLTLTLKDIFALEQHSVTNTLECAGNGRGLHNPKVPGIQWQRGAVGNARFTGPRLADVLQRAGVKSTGKHVLFRGLDGVPGNVPPFIRSIPMEKALDADTLIATHMNGAPLTNHHGSPARALVPGWIGSASCKWLSEIKVIEKEFEGNFMKPGYRYPNSPVAPGGSVNPEETHALTTLRVNSIIAGPAEGASLKSSRVYIHGVAWAGESEIAKVEISVDGGANWASAKLGNDQARYAWRLWSYQWKPLKSGDYEILSRATDNKGNVQPETAEWNPGGYLYNAIDRVRIHVES
jgi:sulfite oxidase